MPNGIDKETSAVTDGDGVCPPEGRVVQEMANGL